MTEYVILSKREEGWSDVQRVAARSANAAISNYLNGGTGSTVLHPNNSGTYVAVPARSWRPVSVKVETKTALRFS